jgi:selenocysteine lyase/cysteine desulfurase
VNKLNEHFAAGVDDLGATLATPRDAHGALMCVKSTDARALVTALDADGIVTSDRDGNLRVSAHCYNTVEDVDAVLAALQRHRELLA